MEFHFNGTFDDKRRKTEIQTKESFPNSSNVPVDSTRHCYVLRSRRRGDETRIKIIKQKSGRIPSPQSRIQISDNNQGRLQKIEKRFQN